MTLLLPNSHLACRLLFEDEALLILEKSAGIPSYPLKSLDENTVANWIVAHWPSQRELIPPLEAGLIHRLDNDTSGLMVAAKSQTFYDQLRSVWNSLGVKKTYLALVLGQMEPQGEINTPLAHHPTNKRKMRPCESPTLAHQAKARAAHTRFQLKKIESLQGKIFSLLEVEITTGVRHQIRAHLASLGHPLAGDKLYQNPKKRGEDTTGLQRHFLHLHRLTFPHPLTKEKMSFVSELPPELSSLLPKK